MPQENVSFQQLFNQGLAAQQQKNWDQALELYIQILDKSRNELNNQLSDAQSSVIHHNMAVVALEKNDLLKAYIWSKKATQLDPYNRLAAQVYETASKKFNIPKVPHQISNFQNFEKAVQIVHFDIWLALCLILFFLALRSTFNYLLARSKSTSTISTSLLQKIKPFLFWTGLSFCIVASVVHWQSQQKSLAIITSDKTAIQTAPGPDKPVIYEAEAGTEVEILQIEQDFAQVKYPGAFSGWLARKNIEMITSENKTK